MQAQPLWDGPTMVVDGESLSNYTSDGWVVLEHWEETVTEDSYDQEVRPYALPDHNYNANNDTGVVEIRRTHLVQRRKFLLGQSKETAVAKAIAERDEAQQQVVTAESHVRTLKSEMEELRGQRDKSDEATQHERTRKQEAEERYYKEHEIRTRLEKDLAKVKSAIGDLRWREIIDGNS